VWIVWMVCVSEAICAFPQLSGFFSTERLTIQADVCTLQISLCYKPVDTR
jgi:hypothetical protein